MKKFLHSCLLLAILCSPHAMAVTPKEQLNVYKHPSCGCCDDWVQHMEQAGYALQPRNTDKLSEIKQLAGVPADSQSCHTAVSSAGYVFEGHVPARYIDAFLADPPQGALGLAVPGMPVGSPGMEMDGRFDPYEVLQINSDGSTRVFATVTGPDEQ